MKYPDPSADEADTLYRDLRRGGEIKDTEFKTPA